MLLSDTVKMRWNSKNKSRYESLGYIYTKMRDEFDVKVEDLPRYSQALVRVKCDYCGGEFQTKWQTYQKTVMSVVDKDCCSNPSCTGKKAREAICMIYGELGTHNPISEAKRKNTNIERYGAYNVFGSDIIKEKIMETNLQKYGVPYSQQAECVRNKTMETCRERYGVDHYVELFKGKFIKENSPVWKGGVSYSKAERATYEYQEWRKSIFIRDNYTCQNCGATSVEIHAHHIFNWADYPDKRYEIENGITLCSKCHHEFHLLYGKKNNTIEQLKEFLELDENIC